MKNGTIIKTVSTLCAGALALTLSGCSSKNNEISTSTGKEYVLRKLDDKVNGVNFEYSFVDENNISVKVLKIVNGNTVEVIFNQTKSINDFPFSVSVSGEGKAEVQLYIDNVYQWSQDVDFSEGGN